MVASFDRVIFSLLLVVGLVSCGKTKPSEVKNEGSPAQLQTSELVSRGRAVYAAVCASCHNMNPELDGALGPSVSGSSIELLEARLLYATYPEGYKPKRDTKQMVALPQFKNDIPAIHAYLNSKPSAQ